MKCWLATLGTWDRPGSDALLPRSNSNTQTRHRWTCSGSWFWKLIRHSVSLVYFALTVYAKGSKYLRYVHVQEGKTSLDQPLREIRHPRSTMCKPWDCTWWGAVLFISGHMVTGSTWQGRKLDLTYHVTGNTMTYAYGEMGSISCFSSFTPHKGEYENGLVLPLYLDTVLSAFYFAVGQCE